MEVAIRKNKRFSSFVVRDSVAEDIDDLSLALALSLQLQDVHEILSTAKGKGKEGEFSDADLALLAHQQHLSQVSQGICDQRLALSISTAVAQDQSLLLSLANIEQQEESDRAFAIRLDSEFKGVRKIEGPTEKNKTSLALTKKSVHKPDEFSEVLSSLASSAFDRFYFKEESFDTSPVAESSKAAASRYHINSRQCVACEDLVHVSQSISCPCKHNYCIPCMRYLFLTATVDESLFPPRCCGHTVPAGIAIRLLEHNELKAFCTKGLEHSSANRIYCADNSCSTFIPPWQIKQELATCPTCRRITHTLCRALEHQGKDCPDDEALQQVVLLGTEKDWQRCFNCHTMVELKRGCNHILCNCGKQFCYECGQKWRTCKCPRWRENRLMDVAHDVADRDAVPGEDIAIAEQRLMHVRDALEIHEDVGCEHHRNSQWRWRDNINLECEVCNHTLPHYIFECKNCRMSACNRCRRNRLR